MVDVAERLRRLVAHPSIAGAGNRELIAEIAQQLQDAGAVVSLREGTRPGVQVLHAVLGPADAEGGLLLAAHGDVVAVEGQPWSADPFALRADDGRLVGRGATDMKGFLAAALAAIAGADGPSLTAPLQLAVSHDEELGCLGVAPLLDALAAGDLAAPPAGVVVGEPTGLRVIERHKGKLALDVTIGGRSAHSATPARGINAVRGAAHLIIALEQLERTLAAESADEAFAVPHATIGIGPIQGGIARNIVPDHCALQIEARLLPGQSVDAIARRIDAVCAEVAAIGEWRIETARVAGYPPLAPEPGDAGFARRIAEIAGRGRDGAVDFGTEAGLYRERLGVPVVVCGPGSMAQGHIADEYLEVAQLEAGERFVGSLIESLGA